jgi:uncharacterized protein (DUF736 family)
MVLDSDCHPIGDFHCLQFNVRMMTAGTHIDCCISNYAQAEIIPNVNKSADAQPDYPVMTHAIETSVDQIMMDGTSDREYASLAFAAPEFRPKKLYTNPGRAVDSFEEDAIRNLTGSEKSCTNTAQQQTQFDQIRTFEVNSTNHSATFQPDLQTTHRGIRLR